MKTKYTLSSFIFKANNVFDNKYDYSLVDFINLITEVKIICPLHGVFKRVPFRHINGKRGCPKCGKEQSSNKKRSNTKDFIEKANKVHNNKYDYKFSEYTKKINKIKIICPIHGIFEQIVSNHLDGKGCQKCGNLLIKKERSVNPNGWSKTNWFKSSLKSKNYNSFKVYIIKCYNETEQFYKIGRTFKTIKNRFHSAAMPYNYEIIKVFEFKEATQENCDLCYDLETKLKQINKENKYTPLLKFCGMEECFLTIKN